MYYNECCNRNGNWIGIVIIVIIILIILFIVNIQQEKQPLPSPIPDIDIIYAYNDVNNGLIQAHEPVQFNSTIEVENTQIQFDQSKSSFILEPGIYDIHWLINISDTTGVSDNVAFGLVESSVSPNLGGYAMPQFLPGSIHESLLTADSNNAYRSIGQYAVTFKDKIELQLREALGILGLTLGTISAEGIEHAKSSFKIIRLDKPIIIIT